MADNTTSAAGPTIATDDIGGVHYQRFKQAFGPDGTATDVSTANPLPVIRPSSLTTGNITAANATPDTGAGTAGSTVTLTVPEGHSSWTATFSGTFSAGTTLAFQTSVDGTNWFYSNGRRNLNTLGTNEMQSITSTDVAGGAAPSGGNPSLWRGTVGSSRYFRITATSLTASDNVSVTLVTSAGVGGTYLLGSIPQGISNIGALYPTPTYTIGSATGTTAATSGQIGRVVRATANVAQTSAATLIAAPAAGTRIYVTNISCTNEGATLSVLRLFAGTLPAAAGAVAVINDCFDFTLAANGGGAGMNFPPHAPWALPTATALSFAVTAATTWAVTVSYYVAA